MNFFGSTELTWQVILFRLTVAFVLSTIIGIEREKSKQVAGLRTHILICVGATLLMILSIYVPHTFGNGMSDPARIAAQVVSGIGFLGAGAILRYGLNVKGLTTAANIWVIAAIGLIIGAGLYAAAIFGTVMILIILTTIGKIEKKFFSRKFMKVMEIEFDSEKTSFEEIKKNLEKFGGIKSSELSKDTTNVIFSRFVIQIKDGAIDDILNLIKDKVIKIRITEDI